MQLRNKKGQFFLVCQSRKLRHFPLDSGAMTTPICFSPSIIVTWKEEKKIREWPKTSTSILYCFCNPPKPFNYIFNTPFVAI